MAPRNENTLKESSCGSPFCFGEECSRRMTQSAPNGPADPVSIYIEAIRDSFDDEMIAESLGKKRHAEAVCKIALSGAEEIQTLPECLPEHIIPKSLIRLISQIDTTALAS